MERHPIIESQELLEEVKLQLRLFELHQLMTRLNRRRQQPQSLIARAFKNGGISESELILWHNQIFRRG